MQESTVSFRKAICHGSDTSHYYLTFLHHKILIMLRPQGCRVTQNSTKSGPQQPSGQSWRRAYNNFQRKKICSQEGRKCVQQADNCCVLLLLLQHESEFPPFKMSIETGHHQRLLKYGRVIKLQLKTYRVHIFLVYIVLALIGKLLFRTKNFLGEKFTPTH